MRPQTAVLLGVIIVMVGIFALILNYQYNQAKFFMTEAHQYEALYDIESREKQNILDCLKEYRATYVYQVPCALEREYEMQ